MNSHSYSWSPQKTCAIVCVRSVFFSYKIKRNEMIRVYVGVVCRQWTPPSCVECLAWLCGTPYVTFDWGCVVLTLPCSPATPRPVKSVFTLSLKKILHLPYTPQGSLLGEIIAPLAMSEHGSVVMCAGWWNSVSAVARPVVDGQDSLWSLLLIEMAPVWDANWKGHIMLCHDTFLTLAGELVLVLGGFLYSTQKRQSMLLLWGLIGTFLFVFNLYYCSELVLRAFRNTLIVVSLTHSVTHSLTERQTYRQTERVVLVTDTFPQHLHIIDVKSIFIISLSLVSLSVSFSGSYSHTHMYTHREKWSLHTPFM